MKKWIKQSIPAVRGWRSVFVDENDRGETVYDEYPIICWALCYDDLGRQSLESLSNVANIDMCLIDSEHGDFAGVLSPNDPSGWPPLKPIRTPSREFISPIGF